MTARDGICNAVKKSESFLDILLELFEWPKDGDKVSLENESW